MMAHSGGNRGKEREKKEDPPKELDASDILIGGFAALALTGLAYGGSKLIQAIRGSSPPSGGRTRYDDEDDDDDDRGAYFGTPRRTRWDGDDDDDDDRGGAYGGLYSDDRSHGARDPQLSAPTFGLSMQAESATSSSDLQSTLAAVVRSRLSTCGQVKNDDFQVSHMVASFLRKRLQDTVTEFVFPMQGNPELVGSSSDGTMIQGKADCDYLLLMQVPETAHPCLTLAGKDEGYWNLEVSDDPDVQQLWRKFILVGVDSGGYQTSYLCPQEVHSFLKGKISKVKEDVCKKYSEVKCIREKSSQAGPALKFEVEYERRGRRGYFDMDFVPCFNDSGKQLTTKRHPNLPDQHEMTRKFRKNPDVPGTTWWRQSFSSSERDSIAPLDKSSDGTLKKRVYRLVKFLRPNNSEFRKFPSFVYKNVFFYLLDDHQSPADWREDKMADRFMDFMRKLERAFKLHRLNHYYLYEKEGVERNLIQPGRDYLQTDIDAFYRFLEKKNRIGKPAWAKVFEDIMSTNRR